MTPIISYLRDGTFPQDHDVGRVSILHIDRHLFNLRLTITFHHLRSNAILESVPLHIFNFNNLIVRFRAGGIVSLIYTVERSMLGKRTMACFLKSSKPSPY